MPFPKLETIADMGYVFACIQDRKPRGGTCNAINHYFDALKGESPVIDIDEFVQGYLDAILFTESLDTSVDSESGEIPDWAQGFSSDCSLLSYGCDRDAFTPEAVAKLREDCEAFIAANEDALVAYCLFRGNVPLTGDEDPVKLSEMAQAVTVRCRADSFGRTEYSASECAGTDFWFSRNHHGAGFSDRGNAPVFRELQDAASVYNTVDGIDFDGEHIHAY